MSEIPSEQGTSRPLSEIKADLFKSLAHPLRVRVLELLADGERSVSDMAAIVGAESSHLSQQLGVLRRSGLVSTRKEGSTVFYTVRDPALLDVLASAKRVLINSMTQTRGLLADLELSVGDTPT